MDMSTYTLEELEHITSEYTLRNQVSAAQPLYPDAPPAPLPQLLNLLLSLLSRLGYFLRGCLLPDRPHRLHF